MVRGDPDEYLKFANSLQNNLQFTSKKVEMEGDLAPLDINIHMSSKRNVTCHWYQKPTHVGIILIQGAVHRVFNATSNWLDYDQALENNKTCWTKNK